MIEDEDQDYRKQLEHGAKELNDIRNNVRRYLCRWASVPDGHTCIDQSIDEGLKSTFFVPEFLKSKVDFERLWRWNARNRYLDCVNAAFHNAQSLDPIVEGALFAKGPDTLLRDSPECLGELDERERMTLGISDGMPSDLKGLADALGTSPERVCQIRRAAILKLVRCQVTRDYAVLRCAFPPDQEDLKETKWNRIRDCHSSRPLSEDDDAYLTVSWYDGVSRKVTDTAGSEFDVGANTLLFSVNHKDLPVGRYHQVLLNVVDAQGSEKKLHHNGAEQWGMPLRIDFKRHERREGIQVSYRHSPHAAKKSPPIDAVVVTLEIEL